MTNIEERLTEGLSGLVGGFLGVGLPSLGTIFSPTTAGADLVDPWPCETTEGVGCVRLIALAEIAASFQSNLSKEARILSS